MNTATPDYVKVITATLQKQMIILGSAITLSKAANVSGLKYDSTGKVLSIEGDGHAASVKLLEQFRELSPLLVKKSMQPLLDAILYNQTPVVTTPQPQPLTQSPTQTLAQTETPVQQGERNV